MNTKKFYKEFYMVLRYGLVGIANTGITALIIFLLKLTKIHYSLYTLAGYAVGIIVSFYLNRRFTFKKQNQKAGFQLVKFLSVTISLLLITQLLQYALIDLFGFNEISGVILGMVFYTCAGYILNRIFVFK